MFPRDIQVATFTSKTSSAGIVNVELGFIPDAAVLISNGDGTNPTMAWWFNNTTITGWLADSVVKDVAGTKTVVTSAISPYAGGDVVASTETTDTAGKHVTLDGVAATAGHITSAGLAIAATLQTAGKTNTLLAFRVAR